MELANLMAIDRTTMVQLVDDLEAAGLVSRIRSARDRRAFEIHLTAAGRRKQRVAGTAMAKAADVLLAPLSRLSATTFARFLPRWRSAGRLHRLSRTRPRQANSPEPVFPRRERPGTARLTGK
jgi:DNA-binding MarR family transcriptional regulator